MENSESDGSDDGFEELRNQNRDDEILVDAAENPGGGGASDSMGGDSDEEHPYDISIAASHSYLGPGLVCVGGRAVLEAGWRGRVPALAHHGVLFPGETVPMLLPRAADAELLVRAIKHDRLFGLLCPDASGSTLSGYGVLCEVTMAGIEPAADAPTSVTYKARAIHRFRQLNVPRMTPVHPYSRMRFIEVVVLPEMTARDTLRASRLASLDPLRSRSHLAPLQRRLRRLDAAATAWPRFVHELFAPEPLLRRIRAHFRGLRLEARLPAEPVSLSFWVASNLALSAADRLALFKVDSAQLRLHMECRFIRRKCVLCCSSCMTQIARREHIFAMSSEGVHSNYTNMGGYMHDILTVSQASNVATNGAPSAEYSWFPGYSWTVALCAHCMAHVGWRFEALKRNLRPHKFFGLCRNYVQPHASAGRGADERDADDPRAVDEGDADDPRADDEGHADEP